MLVARGVHLLVVGVLATRPFRCADCGRRTWARGGRQVYPSEYERTGPEYQYDEIRLVRLARVGDPRDMVGPITRLVRAVRREGGEETRRHEDRREKRRLDGRAADERAPVALRAVAQQVERGGRGWEGRLRVPRWLEPPTDSVTRRQHA